jgi:hypothetical protein
MKTKITTFAKVMLFCLIVVLSSCKKEEIDIANPLLKNYQNSFIKEDFSKIIKTDFKVDWNSMKKGVSDDLKAEVYEFDIRTTLMVPSIPNHKSIYYKLIAFEKEGKQEFHIAKFADDSNNKAVSPSFLDPVNYSGKIYLLNPSGQMEFAKNYQNGLFTGYMNVSNENPYITGRMALDCETFIVTHYTNYWVIVGNFWNYTTQYSYTSYETICSEGGGGSGGDTGDAGYGGDSGGGGSGAINQYEDVIVEDIANAIEDNIDDSQLDPCPKGVFTAVKNSTVCDIAEVLSKLNANKSVYNTTIKSEVAPSGAPAQTVYNSTFNYTTYISTDYAGKTKLFIAATMFHEMIHAYFLSIVDDYKSNTNNNQNLYNLNSFPSLFQAYCDKKYPPASGVSPNLHHLEMANYYVDAIARALQEFQTGIPVAAGTSPQQIYSDLAWGGLYGTPVFDATYPVGNPNRERIIIRYTCEQNGTTIGAGTPNEQTQIGNPCN